MLPEFCWEREFLALINLKSQIMTINQDRQQLSNAAGFGLFEILVSIFLIMVVSMGIASNTIGALHIAKKTEINFLASNLALSKIEDLAAYDVAELDSSFNAVESEVTTEGTALTFTRTTVVSINADSSRTIDVTVSSNSTVIPTAVDFSTTFSLWE